MFLHRILQTNRPLVEYAFWAHQKGDLLPDTYLIDVDAVSGNAAMLQTAADKNGVSLYYMLKQFGRNPYIARVITQAGIERAVAVDYREALSYIKHGIRLGHVGHLVQIPDAAIEPILEHRPEIITVYSSEKAEKINRAAKAQGIRQDIMLRVVGPNDQIYSGQLSGIPVHELETVSARIRALDNVALRGVCAFPCFLYDEEKKDILPTPNAQTVLQAAEQLKEQGDDIIQINMPSANCTHMLPKLAEIGGTHAEPGHAFLGTTPYNAGHDGEQQAIVYLSEVSHNFDKTAFGYGGGYYRRGHLRYAAVGSNAAQARIVEVVPPADDSIDYHIGLEGNHPVGRAVVMSFRTQIFVTRSEVAFITGLSKGSPRIDAVYSALGEKIR